MSDNKGHKYSGPKPWERQPAETEKAFEALRCYLEMGVDRSIRHVAKRLGKSDTIVGRWSKKHEWVKRAREYDNSLLGEADANARELAEERMLKSIMTWREVLWRTSFLGRASLDGALDDNAQFDIKKARETGVIHAIRKINFHPNGMVKSLELRDRNASLHDLGTHHGLWTDEIDDPDEVLSRFLGIPKAQLTGMKLDEPVTLNIMDNDLADNEQS
jgi:transposase-like protein